MEILAKKFNFFVKAILSGGRVGAISSSSNYVIDGVLKQINGQFHTIIEYGPGDGVMTKEILKFLAPNGKIFLVESNPKFINDLRKIKDSRIKIIEGNIQDVIDSKVIDLKDVDLALSSIPFSFLKPAERNLVVSKTYSMLAKNGSFIIFHQYSTIARKLLKKHFRNVSVSFEPRNIFPCFILSAQKTR